MRHLESQHPGIVMRAAQVVVNMYPGSVPMLGMLPEVRNICWHPRFLTASTLGFGLQTAFENRSASSRGLRLACLHFVHRSFMEVRHLSGLALLMPLKKTAIILRRQTRQETGRRAGHWLAWTAPASHTPHFGRKSQMMRRRWTGPSV